MSSPFAEVLRDLAVAQRDLDAGRVRETLALIESALDQSDLTPQFDAIHARLRA